MAITATCGDCGERTRVLDLDVGTYCASCLFDAVDNGYVTVIGEGERTTCDNYYCDHEPMYCEEHASSECVNCGGDAEYCSASCALDSGSYTSCTNCGDDADVVVCGMECAAATFGDDVMSSCDSCGIESYELYCASCGASCVECGHTLECMNTSCDAHTESDTFTEPSPVLLAAERIRSIDDNSFEVGGITFDFDIT